MNNNCPSCGRNIAAVDGENMTQDRTDCRNGEGDVCADGKLYCLGCLMDEKCPCTGKGKDGNDSR